MTIGLFFISLLCAAILDVRTGEVPNRVWLLGLAATPVGLYRLFTSNLVLLYALQSILTFIIVLFCFGIGLLGGADGKAILVMAFVYPWLEIDQITLAYAPILSLIGTLSILGIQCLTITILNVIKRRQYSSDQRTSLKPKRKRHWFTRRISEDPSEVGEVIWKEASVPLVLYILITYLVLLILTLY